MNEETGPGSRAPLLIPYPAGSQLRSSGRLGGPLLRAVTGTLHVLLSSPGISQSPTPNGPPAELQRFPGSGLRDGRSGPFRSPRFRDGQLVIARVLGDMVARSL